jgi:predicted dehydrogenase
MAKVRVGIIGAGAWTVASHIPNLLARQSEVELVAICRKGAEKLEALRSQFGFERAFEDYREVLRLGLDACIVSSPTSLHYEHTMGALESGAHVLCEKPFTIEPAQARRLADMAKRRGKELIVAFGWNWQKLAESARRLFQAPGVGRLEHLTVHMVSTAREILTGTGGYPDVPPDVQPDAATWTDPATAGGGYGHGQLSHALALAMHVTGARVTEGMALMGGPTRTGVELHDALSLRLEGGAVASVSGGSYPFGAGKEGYKFQLEIVATGDEGQLHVDLSRPLVRLYRPDGKSCEVDLPANAGVYDCVGPLNALIDAAQGRKIENCSSGELGARTVEALDVAYRSAASRRVEARA